jgi:hypothetical protein
MPRPDPRQLDLFSAPAVPWCPAPSDDASHDVLVEPIDPDTLDDAGLLEAFQASKLTETERLAVAIARRRPAGWQDAALRVWGRFFGFGQESEQRAVLGLARELSGRPVLEEILRRGRVPQSLNEDLIRAAAACGHPLPAELVRAGLHSRDGALREAAVTVAIPSGVEPLELRPLLTDQRSGVRDLTAIVLAEVGDPEARESLLLSLKARPSERGLDALATFMDEDAIIQLGQLARAHPKWVGHIRGLIEDSNHPKARSIIATLPVAT